MSTPMPLETDLVSNDDDTYRLNAFTSAILTKRDEAVSGRLTSGIESEWSEDEESYAGIDSANRGFQGRHVQTPKTAYLSRGRDAEPRSTVFLNITRPYTDAAASRVADMLVPTDDRPWAIEPTPVPSLSADQRADVGRPEEGEEILNITPEEAKQKAEAKVKAFLENHMAKVKAKSEAMQEEIDDVLRECHWHGEVRHVIEDCARIGSGVIKGPYPNKKTANIYKQNMGVSELMRVEEIKPASKRIDPWNLYPDPACGESLHDGGYIWEREYITKKVLRNLIGMPGYNDVQILMALKEGAKTWSAMSRNVGDGTYLPNRDQFDLWIFHGNIDAEDMRACGCEVPEDMESASAMCVVVNDRLIKAALNVLDTGEFPYDIIAWQRRAGIPWGMGIPRQINVAQRMLNAATREMMNNAGVTAGPQIVIGNGVTPEDGEFNIRGRKLWRAEADVIDVTKAFHGWVPPSMQAELMNIIQFALKIAEDTTGLPMLLQGQTPQGKGAETLGGLQLLQNNASGVMRRLAKRFDDFLTGPHIRRYYDWMMQHSEKQEIKGDFQIDVRASSALVERDSQNQFLLQAAQLAKDPAFKINPAKLFAEMAKGAHLDPKRVQLTPEEEAELTPKTDPVAEATAILRQAQATLATAQAERARVEKVSKSVESVYSATQAAALIAQNAAIAPAADSILLSSGAVDANAPPLVPNVEAQPVVMPPANTSPNHPANPGVGLNAGIEGGQA
ncbi:hypothetical protein BH20PSE1_BH20PSE1_01180 [soil metagenome]